MLRTGHAWCEVSATSCLFYRQTIVTADPPACMACRGRHTVITSLPRIQQPAPIQASLTRSFCTLFLQAFYSLHSSTLP